MADVTVTREIAAPPEQVWDLVSDMTRMGEWSPEAPGGKWLGGASGPAKVATWSCAIEPTSAGCRVTESWTDDRSSFFAGLSKRVTGVKDRAEHNRRNMERTLESLERAATR